MGSGEVSVERTSADRAPAGSSEASPLPISLPVAALLVALLAACLGHPAAATLAIALLMTYGLASVGCAVRAMVLIAVIRVLNPALVPLPGSLAGLTWVAVLLLSARLLTAARPSDVPALLPLLMYSAVVAVLAVANSAALDISLMKLASFSITASACVVSFRSMDRLEIQRFVTWLSSLWLAVACLSLPTLFFRDIGFAINGSGFQGILSHPQALGVFLAPATTFFLMSFLLATGRRRYLHAVFAASIGSIMVATEARTAVLACVLSLASVIGTGIAFRKLHGGGKGRRNVAVGVLGLASVAVVALIIFPGFSDGLKQFILKDEPERHSGDVGQSFYNSRGQGVEVLWQNFLDSPFLGHGFQVSPGGYTPDQVKRLWGVPVSAPVEKGMVFVAVLEETGVIGAAALLPVLFVLIRSAASNSDFGLASLFFCSIFVNFGEAVFFSVGGIGLYLWVLIGASASGTRHALHPEKPHEL